MAHVRHIGFDLVTGLHRIPLGTLVNVNPVLLAVVILYDEVLEILSFYPRQRPFNRILQKELRDGGRGLLFTLRISGVGQAESRAQQSTLKQGCAVMAIVSPPFPI